MRETGIRTNEIGLKIETGIANYWISSLQNSMIYLGPVCRILQTGVLQTGPNSQNQMFCWLETSTTEMALRPSVEATKNI